MLAHINSQKKNNINVYGVFAMMMSVSDYEQAGGDGAAAAHLEQAGACPTTGRRAGARARAGGRGRAHGRGREGGGRADNTT